jgi:hypothetical protein
VQFSAFHGLQWDFWPIEPLFGRAWGRGQFRIASSEFQNASLPNDHLPPDMREMIANSPLYAGPNPFHS